MIDIQKVRQKADHIEDKMILLRREFHQQPELSNQEARTSALILDVLKELNLDIQENLAGRGLVGLLRGDHPGPTIGIRADMDALPIQEKKESSYRSVVPGVMHACGHDVHMASVLGSAVLLSSFRDQLEGNVKFIFQPAEERVSGAKKMINAGVLKNPDVSAIIGFHVYPLLPTGVVGIKYGVMMASSDLFSIQIYGKTGHAAKPHLSVDAILVSAMIINAVHHIISQQIDPVHPAVISIGMIRGGTAENIISDHVEMRGSIRAVTNEIRNTIAQRIEDITRGITDGLGARYRFHFEPGSPPLDNDPEMTKLVEKAAGEILGHDKVQQLEEPSMGGEDFSHFIAEIPGTYFRIGTGNSEKDTCHYLHSDLFDVDEAAIADTIKTLSWSAIQFLNGYHSREPQT